MKYKLLIADDNLNFTMNLKETIEKNMPDYIETVNICNNGLEAINSVDIKKPDILLLDLNMPKKDGLTVLENIKEDIAIIIISGEVSMINNIRIFNSKNIKKIYVKPFNSNHLINELKYICYEKNTESVKQNIENELNDFEFNKTSVGYKYLEECLLYTYKNPKLLDNIEGKLLPLLANKFGIKKVQNIKWSMQKAVKSMIRYTDKRKILNYFPSNGVPTLKLFITTLSNLISKNYKT